MNSTVAALRFFFTTTCDRPEMARHIRLVKQPQKLPVVLGYSPATAVRYLRAAAHLGHFMCEQSRTLADVDLPAFSEHLQACRCPRSKGGRCNHYTVYGAQYFRGFLLAIGVCVPAIATQEILYAEPEVIARFRAWLRKHRGAATATIRLYARDAGPAVCVAKDRRHRTRYSRCVSSTDRATSSARTPPANPAFGRVNTAGERLGASLLSKAASASRKSPVEMPRR